MRFRSTKKWKNIENLGGLLFFAQRAEELLFDYTLDSYKPSALNSVYLCEEAIRLIDDIDKGLIDQANLIPVMEELSWSISKDPVAKSLLDIPKERYLLDIRTNPLFELRLKLEILGRTLEPLRYLERCSELLTVAVKASKKSDIDKLSGFLFTTLINLGMHKSHLYEQTIGFFYRYDKPQEINNLNNISNFLEHMYPYQHDFEVIFLASNLLSDVKDSAEGAFNITFLKTIPEDLVQFAASKRFFPKKNEVLAKVDDIRALDCYTARELAESRLDRLRDLFTLYHHKTQIDWNKKTLIQQCCLDRPRIIGLPKSSIEKGYDQKPERASQHLNTMLRSFRMENRDFQKFNRAVDFHGLSVNNSDPENQLLNLWIALETIVPTHTGKAKIKQIIDGVIPFLAINYYWRLIGKLAQDMIFWNRKEVQNILRNLPVEKSTSLRIKIFLLLVNNDMQKNRQQLYDSLKDFHLLRYRVFSLAKQLQTPAKALEMLEMHEKKVDWQIRRIYRTRNLIVHSGRTPAYVHTLIENGHDYLDIVLMTITHMAGSDYKAKTIDQTFELAKVARIKLGNSLKGIDSYNSKTINIVMNEHGLV